MMQRESISASFFSNTGQSVSSPRSIRVFCEGTLRKISALIAALVLSVIADGHLSPAPAATLIGNGTFNFYHDLTRIEDNGTVLEFLDLRFTTGLTEAQALATYGSGGGLNGGFTVATAAQVASLFDAFGIVYSFDPNGGAALNPSASAITSFTTYLSITADGSSSLGDFDTSGSGGLDHSYFCIGVDCNFFGVTGGFVSNFSGLGAPDLLIGITLVRTGSAATPLPGALPLFASGLGALGLLGWRRKRKNAAALAA